MHVSNREIGFGCCSIDGQVIVVDLQDEVGYGLGNNDNNYYNNNNYYYYNYYYIFSIVVVDIIVYYNDNYY